LRQALDRDSFTRLESGRSSGDCSATPAYDRRVAIADARAVQQTSMDGEKLSAAAIERIVDLLVMQRQEFRRDGAGGEALEANRRQLVYWEQRLASARSRPA
jgi:hypothetical protein